VLALTGAMDSRIVNLVDETPMTIYEIMRVVGATMPSSSEPLTSPFFRHLDGSLARHLGFGPGSHHRTVDRTAASKAESVSLQDDVRRKADGSQKIIALSILHWVDHPQCGSFGVRRAFRISSNVP
jgi:hypothetical protein